MTTQKQIVKIKMVCFFLTLYWKLLALTYRVLVDTGDHENESPTDCNGFGIADRKKLLTSKPPNVLVYADSAVARDNVKEVLSSILNQNKLVSLFFWV